MTRADPRATLAFAEVQVGDVLPELVLPMTATRIVAGAIASRDFMPVHHDRDFANQQGAPQIFMNILSDTAYCSRFVTEWAGPEAMIRRLAIRLGVPAFAGSTLTFTGMVTAMTPSEDTREEKRSEVVGGTVEVALRACNDLGDHIDGTITIALPAPSRPDRSERSE